MSSNDSSTDKKIIRTIYICVLVLIPLAFGGISLYLGKDINWDLRNYHYYNAYSFLENRLGFDIAPAQLQTFYNPFLDIPFYLMAKSFPSWVAGFVLGFVHGLNLSTILLIFWRISNHPCSWHKLLWGICLIIVSASAPGFISELGNTMNDNITSLFALFTIFLLLKAYENIERGKIQLGLKFVGIAGFTMGACVGFKPTSATFAVGSALALFFIIPTRQNKVTSLITFGSLGVIGVLLSTGYWWWELWSRYGNPLMPYFNNIFKSPFASPVVFTDTRFVPKQLWEYFIWPLIFSYDSYRVSELKFFDIRFALFYFISFARLVTFVFNSFFQKEAEKALYNTSSFNTKSGNFLLVFFLSSFLLWMVQSSFYRYIIALELLVPLCFLIVLDRITRSKRVQTIITIGALFMTMIVFRPFNWGRSEWNSSYFSVDTTNLDSSDEVVVIMLGRSPTSYVIPEFPENYRFVRPEGNLFKYRDDQGQLLDRSDGQQRVLLDTKELLNNHTGATYILYNLNEQNIYPLESLARLGISPTKIECAHLIVNTPDKLDFCKISK